MSFRNIFPVIAALFTSKAAEGLDEVKAEEGFAKIELTNKQFEAIEAEMSALAEKATKGEEAQTALATATTELAEVKAANEALTKEKETLTAKVEELNATVTAKDEKLAEYANIAAGGGHSKPGADGKAEQVDVNAGEKPKFTAEWAEKEGLID